MKQSLKDIVPSYEDLLNEAKQKGSDKCVNTISNNYTINWSTGLVDGKDEIKRKYMVESGDENGLKVFKYCESFSMPEIIVENVNVPKRSIELKGVSIHLVKGVTVVRVKKNVSFVKYVPNKQIQDKIIEKLGTAKGTYLVKYEHGNVMDDKIDNVTYDVQKKGMSFGGILVGVSLVGLLLLK